jgi:hypothetical protein
MELAVQFRKYDTTAENPFANRPSPPIELKPAVTVASTAGLNHGPIVNTEAFFIAVSCYGLTVMIAFTTSSC